MSKNEFELLKKENEILKQWVTKNVKYKQCENWQEKVGSMAYNHLTDVQKILNTYDYEHSSMKGYRNNEVREYLAEFLNKVERNGEQRVKEEDLPKLLENQKQSEYDKWWKNVGQKSYNMLVAIENKLSDVKDKDDAANAECYSQIRKVVNAYVTYVFHENSKLFNTDRTK